MIYTIYIIMIADYTYIGSTRDFKQRKIRHKHNFFNDTCKAYNRKLYQSIRENGGWDVVEIKPIEEFECETSVQARIREQFWVREYNATLNMIRAHRTEEEHKQSQREHTAKYMAANPEYNAEYRAAHPEYYREYNAEYRAAHPEYYAEYYAANRDAIKQKAKERYAANCDAIKQHQREKIQCDCGATICRGSKSNHLRTKRHTDRLAEQQQNLAIQ